MSLIPRPLTASPTERHTVSRLLATYFLLQLREEMKKTDAVLYEDYPDTPVRDITHKLAQRVRDEFQIPVDEPLPTDNLFKRWIELNGKWTYEEFGLFGYSQIYIFRLLDLRDGTPESQKQYFDTMRSRFDNFDYEKQGFTVSFFLNSESNMRELMREVVRRDLPNIAEVADYLVLRQSAAVQTAMYEYFEGVLKTALSENIRLLNRILPEQVATELRSNGFVEPVYFSDSAVIFTDFEGFSQATENLSPNEVIRLLDTYFSEFDQVIAKYGLEKIKTIGDSYMAVAGVPDLHDDPVRAACDSALEILDTSKRISETLAPLGWNIRIGIHSGPLIAGVIGQQKFAYDVWGATVNFASRMETAGASGRINVSTDVYDEVKHHYTWEPRGPQPVKNLGLAEMYFLLRKKTSTLEGQTPS
jgi:class 3 adenylate cyclase